MTNQNRNQVAKALFAGLAMMVGLAGCGQPNEVKTIVDKPRIVNARVFTVGDQGSTASLIFIGTIKAQYNASLSSKVMGRVVSVKVREGDSIRLGQPLIAIDSRELQSAVNMADANYHASVVGVGSAKTVASMEEKTSQARIAQAEAQVQQAEASLAAAEAKRDLVLAGPRTQEVAQSHIAVVQAESNLKLAKLELDRISKLVQDGALARREQDFVQNRYDIAKGQYDNAVQAENAAKEGSRSQEIRGAEEAVLQAKGAVRQAKSAVVQAKAAALQVDVRRKDIEVAQAQARQTAAAAQSARVGLSYGMVSAPFDGRVVGRLVDPGSMAAPGTPLLNVEGGEFRFEAIVPEKRVSSLFKGEIAQISIDALRRPSISAKIVEIVPQGDTGSHSFLVKFSLGMPTGVKSGMFGKANIVTGAGNQLVIPASATWVRDGLQYVFAVGKDDIATLRIITLGDAQDGQVQVLSGLNKGDRIVVGDRTQISDGVKVVSN